MGYMTNYELTTDDECDVKHIAAVRAASGYTSLFDDECSWYDHEEVMREYSAKNPTVQFRLYGQDEESGDVWVKWFKAGEMQEWMLEVNAPESPPAAWAADRSSESP